MIAIRDGARERGVDLSNCDREPIHIPGRVQDFGWLISFGSDWKVDHASLNTIRFLGREADDLIGSAFVRLFDPNAIHAIRSRLQLLNHLDAVERLFGLKLSEELEPFDAAFHRSGRSIVMEFEPGDSSDRADYTSYIRPMLDRVRAAKSLEELCMLGARQLRALTGFDRVMVYRFAPDQTGEVIAEVKQPDMEPFLGLRYPASDIPVQARAMYKRNLLRIIGDVHGPCVDLVSREDSLDVPLDLSMSTLRAVSPIHLEYLSNMGVAASMSVSIIVRGELWGLMACHHNRPRIPSFKVRTAAELFGQLFAFEIDRMQMDIERNEAAKARRLHDRVISQVVAGQSIAENFELVADAVAGVIRYDGIVCWTDGEFQTRGQTPTSQEFAELVPLLDEKAAGRIYSTEQIGAVHAKSGDFSDRAAGMLAFPLSRTPRDYLVLFREEEVRSVRWAGDPNKPVEAHQDGTRLTPRKSFEVWQDIVRGRSVPWTEAELQAADTLRITLLEVVLRLADDAYSERERAQGHQEVLIAELNHRVRNILNLIRSLVAQSGSSGASISEFTGVVGGRIDALARAHDMITRGNWSPSSLHNLIAAEASAYLDERANRLLVRGPDVLLHPNAFSTVALVVHELTTNSAKYGALSDQHGQVALALAAGPDNSLRVHWKESGGPPVKPPTNVGFGTTIIKRSIPFDLGGQAELRFEASGIEAEFMLPANCVASIGVSSDATAEDSSVADPETPPLSGHVLLVEDNLIIAMDAESILTELGADRVSVASTVSHAKRLIEDINFTFALLDINLGNETSETIARALSARKVPIVFASGYGEGYAFTADFSDARFLQKPFSRETVAAALNG